MPRTGPSAADRALIAELAEQHVTVTPTQLERWRAAGLLPRNQRRGSGQGRGSTSTTPDGTAATATALARHGGQGITLHHTVLCWFLRVHLTLAASGAPEAVPEPPLEPVRAALLWHLDRTQRPMLDPAAPDGNVAADALAAATHRKVTLAGLVDPLAIDMFAAYIETGALPTGGRLRGRAIRDSVVALHLAQILGPAEVGADLILESLAASGLLPAELLALAQDLMLTWELTGVAPDIVPTPAALRSRVLHAAHVVLVQARDLVHELGAHAAVLQLLTMSAVHDPELEHRRTLFTQHGLGVLLTSLPHLEKPAWAVPLITAYLDPVVYAPGDALRRSLAARGSFPDLDGLLRRAITNMRDRGARSATTPHSM